MALFQLGRERCIFLSDFDPKNLAIELPSDIASVDIKAFSPENIESVFQSVLEKILQLSRSSAYSSEISEDIPQYDHLLDRTDYYVNYESLFLSCDDLSSQEGTGFMKQVLQEWKDECASFRHYEERCLYFFERIGFIPIFGRHDWVLNWCDDIRAMLANYTSADISYCGKKRLDFIRNLADVVIQYTTTKVLEKDACANTYREMLDQLNFAPFESSGVINPLIAIVYYDYLGLINMRLYNVCLDETYLTQAIFCFSRVIDAYVDHVDMSLQIWSGFVYFNLARAYLKLHTISGQQEHARKAQSFLERASHIRSRWLKVKGFNATIRNSLSYEYFICKIEHVGNMRNLQNYSTDALIAEYSHLESELSSYMDSDAQLERLRYVQQLITTRRKELV